MIIRKPYDKSTHEKTFEINTKPSQTIPNQAMSIPELIRRYASGLPLGGARVPLYEENPEEDILQGRNPATLDLSEKHDLMQSIKHEINSIYDRIKGNKIQHSDPSGSPQGQNDEAKRSAAD